VATLGAALILLAIVRKLIRRPAGP
jgi:hypothetical protein